MGPPEDDIVPEIEPKQICRDFQRTGRCEYGDRCRRSHDPTDLNRPRVVAKLKPQQCAAKVNYNAWLRLIRDPPKVNDAKTMERLWQGAFQILDADDRDVKQRLPQDLESNGKFGREHMKALLSMKAHGQGALQFVKLVQPFLSVLTHQAMLGCLSIDTFVGGIYNFLGGSRGARGIPFFQQLSTNLLKISQDQASASLCEKTTIVMLTALLELLRREEKTTSHDDLPELIDSLVAFVSIGAIQKHPITLHIVRSKLRELRGIVARAKGILQQEESQANGISTTVDDFFFDAQEIVLPGARHDNDKMDIAEIRIMPTEDEIRSVHTPFLPSPGPDQPHFLEDPAQRHIDTFFRLLRHDIFGELKDALGLLIKNIEEDPQLIESPNLSLGSNIRAHAYPGAYVKSVSFHARKGLAAEISFSQPYFLRKKTPAEKKTWWEQINRLEIGALLCLLTFERGKLSLLFFTVSRKETGLNKHSSLCAQDGSANTRAELVTRSQTDMELMIRLSCQGHSARGVLVEIPGILLSSFLPILSNLQRMQRMSRLPFQQWILPTLPDIQRAPTPLFIPPPLYARDKGFKFSLKSILKDTSHDLLVSSTALVDDKALVDEIELRTYLDRGQSEALLAALVREFSLLQGPPGTGKSYIGVALMRVLLDAAKEAELGPIVVVCYTNHALDQFLEHLLEVGIENVIRIGGRSKSDKLKSNNLATISKDGVRTKAEGSLLFQASKKRDELEKSITNLIGQLLENQQKSVVENLRTHIENNYPEVFLQFSRIDEEGFEVIGRDPFDKWMETLHSQAGSDDVESIEQLLAVANEDINSLTPANRQKLVANWILELEEESKEELFGLLKEAEKVSQEFSNIYNEVDRRVLESANVIGVTTTGLASRIDILQHIGAKILIVEEAGEIMEPHMLSAMLPQIEQVISIGDHRQLRPTIKNYSLSMESPLGAFYKLDRSQFERLSVPDPGLPAFPVAQLNIQRRMRPEVSTLIRETVYPRLVDHESILRLPDVVGIRDNVYWLDHDNFEEIRRTDLEQKSPSNLWEVDMVCALLRHIVRQGVYTSRDIAVITPYTGQLQAFRSALRSQFEVVLSDRDEEQLEKEGFNDAVGEDEADPERRALEKKSLTQLLRLATVDNFQGEEAKIIIVSLVRSNDSKSVGFLKTTNRINVLLSRAQHGLYLVGNANTYRNVPMWDSVITMLQAKNSVGKSLTLCCPRHPENEVEVSEPDDFVANSPEGGCQLICGRHLPGCKHICPAHCHSEGMHQAFACKVPCERTHVVCGHACQKPTCGEDCGDCMVILDKVLLPCGHRRDQVPCYLTKNVGKIACRANVSKKVSKCNHIVQVQCSEKVSGGFKCTAPCEALLSCGHDCCGTCGQCDSEETDDKPAKHPPCKKVCGQCYPGCNHTCKRACHEGMNCGPCFWPCEVRCAHARCSFACRETCSIATCTENCAWTCEHRGDCGVPCGAPCVRLPCNQRCSKDIACGHQCPGLCGEPCPQDFCQTCSIKQDARVDLRGTTDFEDVDLNETPIIVLSCGHGFTYDTLDEKVGISVAYAKNDSGEFIGLNNDFYSELLVSKPCCPDCGILLRQYSAPRYGRLINKAIIDEASRQMLASGKDKILTVKSKIAKLEEDLDNSREDVGKRIYDALVGRLSEVGYTRDKLFGSLNEREEKCHKLEHFAKELGRIGNADLRRLHEATIAANDSREMNDLLMDLAMVDSPPRQARDLRLSLGANGTALYMRCVVLVDKLAITKAFRVAKIPRNFPGNLPPHDVSVEYFKDCEAFILKCANEGFTKLAVESGIYFAKVAHMFNTYCETTRRHAGLAFEDAPRYVSTAIAMLQALIQNDSPFENSAGLRMAAAKTLELLSKPWDAEVTLEELASIRKAMFGDDLDSESGSAYWFVCLNGHPFGAGKCTKEEAYCPECGSSVT